MSRAAEPLDHGPLFAELNGANDRASIIVAASLVEYALEKAIESRLREPKDQNEEAKLFDDKGLFGTLSQKIWAAYFLKIIGPTVRRDLDLVRLIRNHAVHHVNEVSFDGTSEIASRCRELRSVRETTVDGSEPQALRDRFIFVVEFFVANLLLRAGDNVAEIADASRQLAPYLDA